MAENGLFDKVYNPDVLSCLANLSNDEVFTPPEVVNQMLDMLPQELFSNPYTTFLDPACKTGVFLREIAKRLIKGLEQQIPDLQDRLDHIFHKQLYGIAITELTSLLSRRGLYCSKYPNTEFSVSEFDDAQGNIRYKTIKHTWNDGKCIYCGVSKKTSLGNEKRGESLETYAYEWIHTQNVEEIFNMKFDVIISNPPYQMSDGGGTGDSAKPIYNLFLKNAIKLGPSYISMIIPSRWLKGGKGLDSFREEMMNDERLSYLFDYEDAKECFPGIHLDGGACYFLWEKKHKGKLVYSYKPENESTIVSNRYLNNGITKTVIRDPRQISIIEKVLNLSDVAFSSIVESRNYYGFTADLFNRPQMFKTARLSEKKFADSTKIYGVKGKKGGAKRVEGYVSTKSISKGLDGIDEYKLFFSKAYSSNSLEPPKIILGKPNEICTETFLKIGQFSTEEEASRCLEYMQTRFFKAMLFFGRSGMNMSQQNFDLVPLIEFNDKISDKLLFKKYNLSKTEIAYIDSLFKTQEES